MAPKQENVSNPSQTQKKGGKVKTKRQAQPPPELFTSDTGGSMTDNNVESTMHDVMIIMGSLKTQLTMAEERACLISPSVALALAEDG